MLLAQEDQTRLSKLPSCLITIWFQYQILEVRVHRSGTTGCSLQRCGLSLSLHTGGGVLNRLFISRITNHVFPSGQEPPRAVRPSICRRDSVPAFINAKIRFVLQLPVSKTRISSKHWWQLKVLCGLWAPPSKPSATPPPTTCQPAPHKSCFPTGKSQTQVIRSELPRFGSSETIYQSEWICTGGGGGVGGQM